jgi:hypothetical protein
MEICDRLREMGGSWPVMSAVLRIRDVYPGSDFSIQDPGSRDKKIPDPGSGSASKNLSIFNTKKLFLSSRKYDPGCSSRIRIQIFYPSRIPDPGVKKADPQHWMSDRLLSGDRQL